MYTIEQKQVAVETYLKLKSQRKTIRSLGYPASRFIFQQWINEYNSTGVIQAKAVNRKPRYTDEQIQIAVEHWMQNGKNITKTCNDLGYPCRTVLSNWLDAFYLEISLD